MLQIVFYNQNILKYFLSNKMKVKPHHSGPTFISYNLNKINILFSRSRYFSKC
jgi:hypothetical protein